MKLFLLSGGTLDVDRSVIHPGDDSHRRVTLPCTQILIEQNGHAVLIDTGLPPDVAGDPDALERVHGIEPSWIRSNAAADERVDEQVKLAGFQIRDLDLVVNTHLHFDHAGGNPLVADVTVAVQEAELIAARDDDYLPVWDTRELRFRSVRGDWSPLPGVEMLLTPGHTPGHQSMLVRLEKQPWLFTWDAVYTEEHWRTGKLGAVTDIAAARASIARLHQIARDEKARIIFGHDIVQWSALGMGQDTKPRQIA